MNSAEYNIWALVPCAGRGRRFGQTQPKQYQQLNGVPLVFHCLQRLSEIDAIRGISVGLAEEDSQWVTLTDEIPGSPHTYVGGETRARTVRLGLDELVNCGEAQSWVLVHDAARPCVAGADIERLIREVNFHPAGGLLATPAVDTLKSGDADSRVSGTVSRSGLWRAQTPQLFPVRTLIEAIDHCHDRGEACTDEAQAIEALGLRPKLVICGDYNFKVTHQSDMVIASAILKEQEAASCTE